jgi:hypothetical protein
VEHLLSLCVVLKNLGRVKIPVKAKENHELTRNIAKRIQFALIQVFRGRQLPFFRKVLIFVLHEARGKTAEAVSSSFPTALWEATLTKASAL